MISKIALIMIGIFGCSCSQVPIGKARAARPDQNDTVWWRTEGAVVTGTKQDCSLYLNHKPGVIFIWQKDYSVVGVADDSFKFSSTPEMTLAAIKADDIWIGSDKPSFLATGMHYVLTVSFEGYSDEFTKLLHTSHITIKTIETSKRPGIEINADTQHPKMAQLLDAVNKCRKQLR